jgi:GntR family transcriptional regulator
MYRQIIEILRDEITGGAVTDESQLTEMHLLRRFGVSRAPIRQALTELTKDGYVYRIQGKGTFPIPGVRAERPAAERPGYLYDYLEELGVRPTVTVPSAERTVAPAPIATRLGLAADEKVLHFSHMITVDGRPLVESTIYVRAPEHFNPSAAELERAGSAFELLEKQLGIVLDRSEHEAGATIASDEQAARFDIPAGSALLTIDTLFFTTGGVPAGWRSLVHQADRIKFRFITQG